MVDTHPSDIGTKFADLIRDVDRATYGTVVLADCEPQFSRVLAFVRSHPQSRAQLVDGFRTILSSHITRFCMRQLQWPEIDNAARDRMREDIHNSEYASLQQLLAVYEPESLPHEII
jgi:hypothetical protein